MNNPNDPYNEGFVAGLITTVIIAAAVYGTYKAIEEANKTSDQKLLEHIGRDVKRLERGSDR